MSKLLKNFSSLSIIQVGNYLLPVIYIPVISRIIGPEKYGIIGFASSFVGIFTLLITYGFDLSATRKISSCKEDTSIRNRVFNEVFSSQLLLFIITLILFVLSFVFLPQLNEEKEVALFSFLLCIGTLFSQNWIFQAMQELPRVAVLNFISRLILTSSLLFFLKERNDYPLLPLITGLTNIVISVVSFTWAIKRYQITIRLVSLKDIKTVLWASKEVFTSSVMISLCSNANVFILGMFSTVSQVGFFTAGKSLVIVMHMIIAAPITNTLYPYIGQQFSTGFENGILVLRKIFPIIFLFLALACSTIFMTSPFLIRAFYGVEFDTAVSTLRIMAFVPLLVIINNFFGMYIMLNLNYDKAYMIISIAGGCLSITSNIAFASYFGANGSALNWLLSEAVVIVALYTFLLKRKNINVISIHDFRIKSVGKNVLGILRRKKLSTESNHS